MVTHKANILDSFTYDDVFPPSKGQSKDPILDSFGSIGDNRVTKRATQSDPILDSFGTLQNPAPVISQGDGQPVKPYPTGNTFDPSLIDYFKASFSDDPKALIKVLSQKTGVPENYFGRIDGKMGYLDPYTKKFHPVKEDWFETGQQFVSGMVSEIPTAIGTGLGATLGLKGGLPGFVAGSAAGGALGSYAKQKIGEAWMDDPVQPGPMIFDAVAGGLGGLATGLARSHLLRKVAPDYDKLDEASYERIKANAKKWGIDITEAEASNLNSLKSDQRLLSMAFETSDMAQAHYEKVEGQVYKALSDYLDILSLQKNAMAGERRGVRASLDYISGLKQNRAQASGVLYKEADRSGVLLDASDVIAHLDEELKYAAGDVKSTLSSIKKDFYKEVTLDDGTVERVLKTDVRSLHNILKDIQGKLDAAKERKSSGTKAHVLDELRKPLAHLLESNVDAFKQARTTYSAASNVIGEADDGILGSIAKVKAEKGRFATNMLFDTKNKVNADTVLKVKAAFDAADPGAWDDFVRSHIQNVMERKFKKNAKGSATIGTVLRRELMGSEEQMKVMRAALGEERYAAFHDLMEVIEATSRAGASGSDTALKLERQDALADRAMGVYKTPLTVGPSPFEGTRKLIRGNMYEALKKEMAEAIFNKEYHGKLRIMRGMTKSEKHFLPLVHAFFADLALQGTNKGFEATHSDIPLRTDGDYMLYIKNNPHLFGGQKQ